MTAIARAVESSQFDAKRPPRVGRLSVWPSTRTSTLRLRSSGAIALSVARLASFTRASPVSKITPSGRRRMSSLRRRMICSPLSCPSARAIESRTARRPSRSSTMTASLSLSCLFSGDPSTRLPPASGRTLMPTALENASVKRPTRLESTCETANMTTKKANSSVMKSA